jgi:amino acid transporter
MALMDETERPVASPQQKYLTVRQAAFIGVGAMVGAGIFALLGAAGEVAGAAVWLSFLIAGVIAGLQGYSFAKLGARYPSAGGCWSTWPEGSVTATSPASPPG